MQCKRFLSVLLACLMLTGILAVGANAWPEDEQKTEASYGTPLIGKYLAWPGEMLVTKLLLPRLLGGLSFSIVGDICNDAAINDALAGYDSGTPEPRLGQVYAGLLTPDIEDAGLKTAFGAIDSLEGLDIAWGVTDEASFVNKLALALRLPFVFATLQGVPILDELAQAYPSVLAAMAALGVTPVMTAEEYANAAAELTSIIPGKIGPIFYMPQLAQALTLQEAAKLDQLVTAVAGPLLPALKDLAADPLALLFEKLPNLLYNADKLAALFSHPMLSELVGGTPIDFNSFIGAQLTGALEGILPGVDLDIAGLLEKITFAGDLGEDGAVKADKSLIYNILVNFLLDLLKENQEAILPLLKGLLPFEAPDFLVTVLYYLVRALVWLLRL